MTMTLSKVLWLVLAASTADLNDKTVYLLSTTRYDVDSAKWPNYGFRVVALGSGKAMPATKKPATKN